VKRAIELTPDNGAAWANLAAIYLDTEDPKYSEDATKALQRSLELAPTYPAYANLGFLYLQQKKYADAANVTEKALAINSNNPQVWENMAVAREWLGEKDKAVNARQRQLELLERDLKDKPNDAQTQAKLAYLYGIMQQPAKAKALINSALTIAPQDTTVLANVGEAYECIGDRKSALRYLREALHKGFTIAELQRSYRMQSLITDPALRGLGR
jgi:serine/threonine-protein kinase